MTRIDLEPEVLRSLSAGSPEAARKLTTTHEADVAEVLNRFDPEAAAQVVSALPFDFAVRVLEQPEFERRAELFRHFASDTGVGFIRAMSPDQQAYIFRELPDEHRRRLLEGVDDEIRNTLALLLQYPPTTAGGIMTT